MKSYKTFKDLSFTKVHSRSPSKNLSSKKVMETWIWILIIVVVLLALVGLGVGLYFVFRKSTPASGGSSSGGGGGTGRGGSKPTKTSKCKTTAKGSPGTISGAFSLIPAGAPARSGAITITDVTKNATPMALFSNDPSKIYTWTTGSYKLPNGNSLSNVLKFGAEIDGVFGCDEGVLLVSDSAADRPAYVDKPGILKFSGLYPNVRSSWTFTPYAGTAGNGGTFCEPSSIVTNPRNPTCLFYDSTRNTITSKTYEDGNVNFYWLLGPPNPNFG